jgi:hypothetical protein
MRQRPLTGAVSPSESEPASSNDEAGRDRIFDPDGEPATSSAMDEGGDGTTYSTTAGTRSSVVTPTLEKKGKQRISSSVTDDELAKKIPGYLQAKAISLAELAEQAGTTERTLRNFRNGGKVRRDIYRAIEQVLNSHQE